MLLPERNFALAVKSVPFVKTRVVDIRQKYELYIILNFRDEEVQCLDEQDVIDLTSDEDEVAVVSASMKTQTGKTVYLMSVS